MKNFAYYRPSTVDQAIGLLDAKWGPAALLAGGTDLHDLQKDYIEKPEKVISLNGIKELAGITIKGGSATLGAGTRLADIAEHKELRELYPALTTTAGMIGGPQIRNVGTLGGNLCQRNHCWYFRDEQVKCLLKGGDKCFALDGDNRYHACFAQGHACVIVNPSSLGTVLMAIGAKVNVVGPKGARAIAMDEFFQAPKSTAPREHTVAPNEVVTSIVLSPGGDKNASYEVRHKASHDWPCVQAVVAYKDNGGKATNVRVVLGHVAPTPLVATAAAKALEGKAVTAETATAAGKAATEGAKPLSQTGYKVQLIEVAVKRALLTAAGAKKYWEM